MTKIRCVTRFSCKALGGFSLHLTFGECETWRRLEALLILADGGIPCGGCGGGVLACDGPTRVKTLDSAEGGKKIKITHYDSVNTITLTMTESEEKQWYSLTLGVQENNFLI